MVLGTAGHIDHGKTALIGALTGTDTDRLEEERRRGISIELGFAELPLPDGRTIGVVDVPGHERLIRTMVAGAAGIDLFLLVIAADDGVMPQTREHLTALRSLGVERGVVALTKHDAAPAESLELARAEAAELLPDTPLVEVSARTGHGVEELRRAIAAQVELAAAARSGGHNWAPLPALLPLDRVFALKGIGTVATGTLRGGDVAPGDLLLVHPAGEECRVRSVQVHGEAGRARRRRAAGRGQRHRSRPARPRAWRRRSPRRPAISLRATGSTPSSTSTTSPNPPRRGSRSTTEPGSPRRGSSRSANGSSSCGSRRR